MCNFKNISSSSSVKEWIPPPAPAWLQRKLWIRSRRIKRPQEVNRVCSACTIGCWPVALLYTPLHLCTSVDNFGKAPLFLFHSYKVDIKKPSCWDTSVCVVLQRSSTLLLPRHEQKHVAGCHCTVNLLCRLWFSGGEITSLILHNWLRAAYASTCTANQHHHHAFFTETLVAVFTTTLNHINSQEGLWSCEYYISPSPSPSNTPSLAVTPLHTHR